jgi:hypothetical protein
VWEQVSNWTNPEEWERLRNGARHLISLIETLGGGGRVDRINKIFKIYKIHPVTLENLVILSKLTVICEMKEDRSNEQRFS